MKLFCFPLNWRSHLDLKYIIPFFTLLIGALIGNWLAIGRDRRKDFNKIANPLFERLEKQRLTAISGKYPSDLNHINSSTFIQLERQMSKLKLASLKKSVESYLYVKSNCGSYSEGRYYFDNPTILLKAISDLQKFMPHK